ncbi:hypothetical protein [Nocardioides sp. GXZ039]|uniref:hypothetical protein n=1 Tax=Nocardioides sp. GXZ039 TaxID=3136018 RepID=UPI0030F48C79
MTEGTPGVWLLTEDDTPYVEVMPGTGSGVRTARSINARQTTQLGGGFVRIDEIKDAEIRNWKLQFDEAFFVISGEFWVETDGVRTTARAGEGILIAKGTTVSEGGKAGSRAFVVLWPHDWYVPLNGMGPGGPEPGAHD